MVCTCCKKNNKIIEKEVKLQTLAGKRGEITTTLTIAGWDWKKAIKRNFSGTGDRSGWGTRNEDHGKRRKTGWKRPFRTPRAFRRGEMARLSHRTDIRPVQQPRTKSYIHASSHYASLSRLGSGVRTLKGEEERVSKREGKRRGEKELVQHER